MKKRPSTNESPVAAARPSAGAPLTIGWKERVDFPAWSIRRVKVKIDTGARTSALGVLSYDLRHTDSGLIADLRLALSRKHPERVTTVTVPVLGIVVVPSSTSLQKPRTSIETIIHLATVTKRLFI